MEQSYKEKYEQAIERLKQWDREHPCDGYVLSDRDKFIFPELAESNDEKIRKVLIKFFSMGAKNNLHTDGIADKDIIAWLEKQGEQKPEENKGNIGGISPNWSKEDEAFLDDILCKLEHDLILNKDEKDWLKSLRPQNRWKPNDEQIAQLQIVIDTYGNEGICDPILTELLFQLKKLRSKV